MNAEELIADVYGRISRAREAGQATPSRIVMSVTNYRLLQSYRARLGETPDPSLDYLGKYELFGLPIFIEEEVDLRVE